MGSFDGSIFMEKQWEFRVGFQETDDLPVGVEDALLFFSTGERRFVDLSPDYGFGSSGRPDLGIPPDANLRYDVTLLSCESVSSSLFSLNLAET